MSSDALKRSLLAVLSIFAFAASSLAQAERPNVIVFFTDDQGWADLGVQGILDDIKTPNIDRMAREGVRFTNGYSSSPQCTPSRAGLLSGQYQGRFGLDDNAYSPLSRDVMLLPQRLQRIGYTTGLVGKWHLELNRLSERWLKAHQPQLKPEPGVEAKIPFDELIDYFPQARGFDEVYFGYEQEWWINFDRKGNTFEEPRYVTTKDYRLDVVSEAALQFIDRNHEDPFFLYVPYYAPHVPMEATQKYLDRFPGDMPERRRYCLAMMSAVDDGVGSIMKRLEDHGIDENTLVFFLSDNGAPIKMTKEDKPISYKLGAWDGSLNGPLNGEKGMLAEGGIRVPFVAWWKSKIPGGQVIDDPVIALDISATVMGQTEKGVPGNADGVDLMPLMTKQVSELEERSLYWKFWTQRAVRKGKWKYLEVGDNTEFLFDLDSDIGESKNLANKYPELMDTFRKEVDAWTDGMQYPDRHAGKGRPQEAGQEAEWFQYYFGVTP
ncbi:sulfatase-like hydrolase/transferase [Pelagicoccus mobilis]|uniref:sulfatase-like hydrolase/transferase n=1 Tax=Pelagicoccus mobilis TaxID=415221 RepID=UPI0019074C65|nr:sulfatase-like hydrolase/transferase [Pelagicoccus mobilis]